MSNAVFFGKKRLMAQILPQYNINQAILSILRTSAPLAGVLSFEYGETYYFAATPAFTVDEHLCKSGVKFSIKVADKVKEVRHDPLSDIAYLNEHGLGVHPHVGSYIVRKIDNDGRIRLSYLSGEHFNHQNIGEYRNQVLWTVEDENGNKHVYRGKLGWKSGNGSYAFLIRDRKNDPFPKEGTGFIIESAY